MPTDIGPHCQCSTECISELEAQVAQLTEEAANWKALAYSCDDCADGADEVFERMKALQSVIALNHRRLAKKDAALREIIVETHGTRSGMDFIRNIARAALEEEK